MAAKAADPRVPALRIPANRVSQRAIAYWTARSALAGLVILAAESAAAVVAGFSPAWLAALAASAAVLAGYAVVMPRWRYRVHRWEVTDTALYTRYVRAWWFTVNWRIAPISRIQTIDSHRSFGERLFGLANVTATTASAAGPIRIHGLDTALADRLLDQLAVATGRTPGDAT
jgi:membrane protein YdbS with pleckstrin-like domain